MVCKDGGVICIPKNSIELIAHCFESSIKCDGMKDCEDNQDENDCSRTFETNGVIALVVIACLILVALIPILYVVIQKKRGKPIVPATLRQCWQNRARKDSHTESGELQPSQSTHSNTSAASNVGFTNASFDPPKYSPTSNGYGSQVQRFQKSAADGEQRSPSVREWQSTRLNGHAPDNNKYHYQPNAKKDLHSSKPAGVEPLKQADVHYHAGRGDSPSVHVQASGLRRPAEPAAGLYSSPYSGGKSSKDPPPAYTITQNDRLSTAKPANVAPWDRPAQSARMPHDQQNRYNETRTNTGYQMRADHNNTAEQYQGSTDGVSPRQLRTALQHVSTRPTYGYSQYSPNTAADTSTDTVV